jgi:hypothetical protein
LVSVILSDKVKLNLVIMAGPYGAGKSTVADFLMLNQKNSLSLRAATYHARIFGRKAA